MGRGWSRAAYRPGTAERWHAEFQYRRGRLTAAELDHALHLAGDGRNRSGVRNLLGLRGAWLADRGDWASAAASLAALRDPADLPLAEFWQALGDTPRATDHALATYRWAWADGEPYVHRYELDHATELLKALGAEIPTLPAYDPAADPPLPFEAQVEAAIERLRAEKNARP